MLIYLQKCHRIFNVVFDFNHIYTMMLNNVFVLVPYTLILNYFTW